MTSNIDAPKMIKTEENYNFDLGTGPVYHGGVEMNYKYSSNLFFTSFLNYTYFKYGKSQTISGSTEPDSITNEFKLGIGIRYSWIK